MEKKKFTLLDGVKIGAGVAIGVAASVAVACIFEPALAVQEGGKRALGLAGAAAIGAVASHECRKMVTENIDNMALLAQKVYERKAQEEAQANVQNPE